MTTSTDSTGRIGRRTQPRRFRVLPSSLTRYDLVLLVIPLAFLLALGLGVASPVPMRASVVTGSLFAAAVVADALFRNPPTAR